MKRCNKKWNSYSATNSAPGVCSRYVCVFTSHSCVCVQLDGLNAEQKFWVWVTSIIIIIHYYITIILILHIKL